ncbi:MAG: hypothetical protein FJ098_01675, partial [Deltaproteobacteria bacterium]|nr:hypothetical protein [Deltaproteobacteria bacterium]
APSCDSAREPGAQDTTADQGAAADTLPDTAAGDAASDAAPDAVPDSPSADLPPTGPYAAVPGARCSVADRVGLVSVYSQNAAFYASASIDDRPSIEQNEPELSDEACTYMVQLPPGFCEVCPEGTRCDHEGVCQAVPKPFSPVLTLRAQDQSQSFEGTQGSAWGEITLPGDRFAVEVTWEGVTVTLEETGVPGPLDGVTMTLDGTYDQPTGLDIAWTPSDSGALVYTNIPMNHHAMSWMTYTECAVDEAAGALHVDGAMLVPLSVVTGLEFQGVSHVRFAAAQTPAGCVEFRFETFQHPN